METPAPPQIIILNVRGLHPDMRLHVLDLAVFHVHSTMLKMQSNFFFKFLDSAEKTKTQTILAYGQSKYEWVTKVDDDGTWSLIAATNGKVSSWSSRFDTGYC